MSVSEVPAPLEPEPLAALWALLVAGLAYANWFHRPRPAWGFGLLGWITATTLSGELLARLGYEHAERFGALAWQAAPLNLLLFACLPQAALRGRWAVLIMLFFVGQLLALGHLAPELGTIPDFGRRLLADVPDPLRGILDPPGAVLAVLATIIIFARWQAGEELTELAHFALATLLLVAVLLPDRAAVAIAVAAGLLLGSLVLLAHRMAFVDTLTGLDNRRALEAALPALPPRYAVAMLDIDHFKSVNDRFGHDVGDQVLRMTASRLRHAGGFRAYRYGGEEFCLLFRGRRVREARRLCERVRAAVSDPPMVIRRSDRPARGRGRRGAGGAGTKSLSVTVSIGLAFPKRGEPPATALEAADRVLYRAKRGGRDRVTVAGKPAG